MPDSGGNITLEELFRQITLLRTENRDDFDDLKQALAQRVTLDRFEERGRTVDVKILNAQGTADGAKVLAMWALGLILTAVLGGFVWALLAMAGGHT